MLKNIDINNDKLKISYTNKFDETAESNSYLALYKNETKVVKIFKNKDDIENKVKKIILLKERLKNNNSVVCADDFITLDNEIIGYIMPFIEGENNYSKILNKKNYIIYLKKMSKLIKDLHELNIVLADFHSNIITDKNNKLHFIDHDNFAIDNLPIDQKNIYLKAYEKNVDIFDKNFDYYLLNLYTIAALKKICLPYIYSYYQRNLHEFNFKNEEITNIFFNTMNLNKVYNEELIIDKIQNTQDIKKLRIKYF